MHILDIHVCPSVTPHRHSKPVSGSRVFKVNTFFKTAKTDKKETIKRQISLHRFKPVIFSKMIQNCLNQVEDW